MTGNINRVGEGSYAIAGDYLVALQEFAAEKGVTPQALLEGTGIPISALIKPHLRVGYESMDKAVHNLMTAVNDPLLSIEYGKKLTISKHGVLGYAAQSSQTLKDAAKLMIQFLNTRSGGGEELEIVENDESVILRFHSKHKNLNDQVATFHMICTFVSIETIARWLVGKAAEDIPTKINIAYSGDLEIPDGLLSPGLSINFDCMFNELSCPVQYFNEPLLYSNPTLEKAAQEECEAELAKLRLDSDIASLVRLEIRESSGRLPGIDQIAERLSMSSRTLKRRLQEAGTTYQKIKDDEQCRKAMSLLESTQDTIERIAEQLGYSDASNFTKAFKTWADLSPNEFRNKLAQ